MRDVSGVEEVRGRNGLHLFDVDTKRATFRGKKYRYLDDWERRKFENLLVLSTNDQSLVLYDGQRRHRHNPHLFSP